MLYLLFGFVLDVTLSALNFSMYAHTHSTLSLGAGVFCGLMAALMLGLLVSEARE